MKLLTGRPPTNLRIRSILLKRLTLTALVVFRVLGFATISASAGEITLPPEAKQAMAYIYGGHSDEAEPIARSLEQQYPDHPLGFLLEAESEWWGIYCAACEIKWRMVDDWDHGKRPSQDSYIALADKVIGLSQKQLAQSETAEMHVYAGLGWALRARVFDERDDHRNIARSAVAARAEFVRALQVDPEMADASAGLGLYDYYVDTLSPLVKLMRLLMRIPGGDRQEGIRLMREGIDHGVLFAVDTRYYLAKNLRTFDLKYQDALDVAQPLVQDYPNNPIFSLLAGNLNMELGRKDQATGFFNAAIANSLNYPRCEDRIRNIARAFLADLPFL